MTDFVTPGERAVTARRGASSEAHSNLRRVELETGPFELDAEMFRLIMGPPPIGEVIGGPLDGLRFEIVEATRA